ncbi:hypothetical protein HAV22_15365 [Massilia sp. TW-1]|uniref:Transposase n=1 Tax=Telluria antibiotica TaxID=2717319 RepID=A0ABX0PG52_9BURK|nr:hypothetical protein [Telluria antibiotica]NIA55015.1 hypothetical protein [Telluria antibiotica]
MIQYLINTDAARSALSKANIGDPDAMRIRRSSVEHPYGTIKSWMAASHFLTKGLECAKTEMSQHVLAYHFRRLMAIPGRSGMVAAIRALARFLKRCGLLWGVTVPSWPKPAEINFGATRRLRPLQY